jgi:tetratricopeptide (TPR) repeat protein
MVRAAVQAADIARATDLANALASADERRLWLGILAILGNEPVKAIRILRADANNPKALGVAYYLARQYLLFRDRMSEAIRRNPDDFGPYYFLGRHYDADLDNSEEAVRWFRRALAKDPGYARARAYLGTCLERLGQAAEAEAAFRASIDLPLSQFGMARLKLAAGETEEALGWVERALEAEPRDVPGQRLAARLYETLGRPAEALAALEQAARAAPADASLHYLLHRLHRASGREAKAKAELTEFERLRAIYGAQP